ncbi:helix-turn-helix domain-containing protein [Aureimonas mangrovi]|uniref:helix-turn-helix domain-containing protein n=1 Tax=Aureimonas mangrovi TaxID=2758041 RepID=UPI00163D72D3|nr:helix-turn-helix transcriptional regulator [Aureimonas mangrovi]
MSTVDLSTWRITAGKNLREIAEALGIGGANPGRTLQRYENGSRACPLDLAVAIQTLTEGAVTPGSMAATRAAYLRDHGQAFTSSDDGKNGAEAASRHVNDEAAGSHAETAR